MNIEYYEFIVNKVTNAVGITCNSREYKISSFLESQDLEFTYSEPDDTITVINKKGQHIKYLFVPKEKASLLQNTKQILFMCGLPSPHDDEPPEVEAISLAKKRL